MGRSFGVFMAGFLTMVVGVSVGMILGTYWVDLPTAITVGFIIVLIGIVILFISVVLMSNEVDEEMKAARAEKTKKVEKLQCSYCGSPVGVTNIRCDSCGAPIGDP